MNIVNRRAKFEYLLEPERYEAGLVLSGSEAKAIRTGHADVNRAVVRVLNGEVYLLNANIPVLGGTKYDAKRTRKLLLHRDEIVSISTKAKQKKLTLVPLSVYTKGRLIKLELALGRSKKKFEKKEVLKKKDLEREIRGR